MAKKIKFNEKNEPYFEYRKNGHKDTEFINQTLESNGYVKDLTVNVILKRSFYSPQGEPKVWFGLQSVKVSIPNEKSFQYYYLYYDPKAMQNVCVSIISPQLIDEFDNINSVTYNFNLQPKRESLEYEWVRLIGKPKSISKIQASAFLKSKYALCVLTDSGELAQ
jgi:hypothetical protein